MPKIRFRKTVLDPAERAARIRMAFDIFSGPEMKTSAGESLAAQPAEAENPESPCQNFRTNHNFTTSEPLAQAPKNLANIAPTLSQFFDPPKPAQLPLWEEEDSNDG